MAMRFATLTRGGSLCPPSIFTSMGAGHERTGMYKDELTSAYDRAFARVAVLLPFYCERPALRRVNGCSMSPLVPGSRPRPLLPWSAQAAMSLPTSLRPWSIGHANA